MDMNIGFAVYLITIYLHINNLCVICTCPDYCKCNSPYHVECKQKSLTSVPASISIGVTYLDLSFNNIKNLLNSSFIQFRNLKVLNLNHNNMKTIDENAFQGLANLKELYLVHNDLSYLHPETFNKGLNKLLHLFLGDNEFESIPILKANEMTKLNLDSNRIKTAMIDKSFLQNIHLQTLVLTKNQITAINENDFANLRNTQLISLMLKFNNLEDIHPQAFMPVKDHLQNLEFEGNKRLNSTILENALKSFNGGGGSLIYLDLKDCGLTSISDDFFKPLFNSKLHQLDISHNTQLTTVTDDAFDGLTNVQILKLTNCHIASSAIRFSGMVSLRELHISHNNLIKCPFRLSGSLRKIDLQSNSIRQILKDDFKSLTELQQLNLRSNTILSIEDESFSDLNQLVSLDLSFNRFSRIKPHVFGRMGSLVTLQLQHQTPCIETLQPGFFVLENLQSLDLEGNCISFAESDHSLFAATPQLVNLSLRDNKLSHLGDDLFSRCDNLRNVDLSRNQLTRWGPGTFARLRSSVVTHLQLAFNRISTVSLDPADRNYLPTDFSSTATRISLDNNLWNCTCRHVRWLVKYQQLLDSRDNIVCYEPNASTGKRLLAYMGNCSKIVDINRHASMVDLRIEPRKSGPIRALVVMFCCLVIAMLIGVVWRYRIRILFKYFRWKNSHNPYDRIAGLSDSVNGMGNDYLREDTDGDHSRDQLVINEAAYVPVACHTWQTRLKEAPSDEQLENFDMVLVCSERHDYLNNSVTPAIYQINELTNDDMRVKVYQCEKLVIDYPPPDEDVLREILDMRTENQTNFILLAMDKSVELLEDATNFHSNYSKPILRYDPTALLNVLLNI